jgi:hypothetical protein
METGIADHVVALRNAQRGVDMAGAHTWVLWFTMLFGVLCILFSKQLGRNVVKTAM